MQAEPQLSIADRIYHLFTGLPVRDEAHFASALAAAAPYLKIDYSANEVVLDKRAMLCGIIVSGTDPSRQRLVDAPDVWLVRFLKGEVSAGDFKALLPDITLPSVKPSDVENAREGRTHRPVAFDARRDHPGRYQARAYCFE